MGRDRFKGIIFPSQSSLLRLVSQHKTKVNYSIEGSKENFSCVLTAF